MWSYESVLETLLQYLRQVTNEDVGIETRLGALADFDSLDTVDFVMRIEETFRCDLDDSAYDRETTLAQLAEAIWNQLR